MKKYRLSMTAALVVGAVATIGAGVWFSSPFVVCPGVAFTAMLVLGSDLAIERMQKWIEARRARIVVVPAATWALYLIYAVGMGVATPIAAAVMALYLSVPFVVLGLWPKAEPLVILWLWLPLELGILRQILTVHTGPDLHYAFAQILAIDTGIIAFAVWNRTPGIGYRLEWDGGALRSALTNFVLFAAIGIPLGLAIGFIRYNFALNKLYTSVPLFVGIFFLTALTEEFLFRGLIQNWIERVSKRPVMSLAIASIIFGASHLNNGLPIPNYRYFVMATIAGLFYGRAWRSERSLMASSLTHALVDTVWSVVFR